MRIQHNIAALNSHRQLTSNNSSVAKNLEKLSSGYKINRAGDDAAGLAISEKMRAQITGLNTASKNANDGISLVQTAEGALTEVHSMLNRMAELAAQSANGTYQDDVDRENIQKEYNSLKSEVDRISAGTNFNGIKLLDGTLGSGGKTDDVSVAVTATIGGVETKGEQKKGVASVYTTGSIASTGKAGSAATVTVTYTDAAGKTQKVDVEFTTGATSAATANNIVKAINANSTLNQVFKATTSAVGATGKGRGIVLTGKISTTGSAAAVAVGVAVKAGSKGMVATGTIATAGVTTTGSAASTSIGLGGTFKAGDRIKVGSKTFTYVKDADGSDGATFGNLDVLKDLVEADGKYSMTVDADKKATFKQLEPTEASGLKLQIGESSDEFNQIGVAIKSMSSATLGIDGLDLGTQEGAKAAMSLITKAINSVSSTRGDLGAIQNRLEHTINNLGVTAENMSAAESRIRDVDMAQEMMAFTKNNILTQASQAMLAQANQLPQGVLQLLQ